MRKRRTEELVRGRDVVVCAFCSWTSNPLAAGSPAGQYLRHVGAEHRDTWLEAA